MMCCYRVASRDDQPRSITWQSARYAGDCAQGDLENLVRRWWPNHRFNFSRKLRALTKAGLIAQSEDQQNGKKKRLRLTDDGRSALEKIRSLRAASFLPLFTHLNSTELAEATMFLERLERVTRLTWAIAKTEAGRACWRAERHESEKRPQKQP